MSARECQYCIGRGKTPVPSHSYQLLYVPDEEPCEQCGGSGKVWPSVEGEIVVEECAYQLHTESIDDGNWALDIDVPGPGFYRIIVQPIDSKPCPS